MQDKYYLTVSTNVLLEANNAKRGSYIAIKRREVQVKK